MGGKLRPGIGTLFLLRHVGGLIVIFGVGIHCFDPETVAAVAFWIILATTSVLPTGRSVIAPLTMFLPSRDLIYIMFFLSDYLQNSTSMEAY